MSIKEYLEKQKALKDTLIKGVATAATVGMLVTGGLTACDKTPDNPIVDDTKNPSVSDTIKTPSESTPVETEPNETTTPEDTTKEPEDIIEIEPMTPEMLEKYPPISDEDYNYLINKMAKFNPHYAEGLSYMMLHQYTNGNIVINYYPQTHIQSTYYSSKVDKSYYDKLMEIYGSSATIINSDSNKNTYMLILDKELLPPENYKAILNIISDIEKDHELNKQQ